jgi:hypothetical protein
MVKVRVIIDAQYEVGADGKAIRTSGQELIQQLFHIEEFPVPFPPDRVMVLSHLHFPLQIALDHLESGRVVGVIVEEPGKTLLQKHMIEVLQESIHSLPLNEMEGVASLKQIEEEETPSWKRGAHYTPRGRRRK